MLTKETGIPLKNKKQSPSAETGRMLRFKQMFFVFSVSTFFAFTVDVEECSFVPASNARALGLSHSWWWARTEGNDLSLRQPDVTAVLLGPGGRQTKLIKAGEGRRRRFLQDTRGL